MNILGGRLRSVVVSTLLAATAACGAGALAADASAKTTPKATGQCKINFQASSLNLKVGQDLVLTWTAVGASKLTASWTSGYVPFAGAVTTTMDHAGTFAYQVTGTSAGKYCGGAGVEVAFRSASPTNAVTSSPPSSAASSSKASSAAGSGSNGGTNGGAAGSTSGGTEAGSTAGSTGTDPGASGSSTAAAFPAQSPTGGSGVPWYGQPGYLIGIAALALLGALVLVKRPARASYVRRH